MFVLTSNVVIINTLDNVWFKSAATHPSLGKNGDFTFSTFCDIPRGGAHFLSRENEYKVKKVGLSLFFST